MNPFTIICPECGSKNCTVDAFKTSSQTSVNPGGMVLPMITCDDCEYHWNPTLTNNLPRRKQIWPNKPKEYDRNYFNK